MRAWPWQLTLLLVLSAPLPSRADVRSNTFITNDASSEISVRPALLQLPTSIACTCSAAPVGLQVLTAYVNFGPDKQGLGGEPSSKRIAPGSHSARS